VPPQDARPRLPSTRRCGRLRTTLQPTPDGGLSAGCHDEAFWTRSAAAEIYFLGHQLAG
jgi:hypothetical protein